jgi:hypothetical protein
VARAARRGRSHGARRSLPARRRGRTRRRALRAAEQAAQVLDHEAALARTGLGLACDPPPELRITLLGVRCFTSLILRRISIPETEELLRSAPRGSIPWAQGLFAYIADRIADPDYRASFLDQVPENARTLALAAAWLGDPAPARPGEAG